MLVKMVKKAKKNRAISKKALVSSLSLIYQTSSVSVTKIFHRIDDRYGTDKKLKSGGRYWDIALISILF